MLTIGFKRSTCKDLFGLEFKDTLNSVLFPKEIKKKKGFNPMA